MDDPISAFKTYYTARFEAVSAEIGYAVKRIFVRDANV